MESGLPLYPGIDSMDNALRWGFVRKVGLGKGPAARRHREECHVCRGACTGACLSACTGLITPRALWVDHRPAALLSLPHCALPPAPPPWLQVYGIISMQLLLTTIVAAAVVASPSAQRFLLANWGLQLGLLLLSMLGLIPLYAYRQSHPTNLLLLGCWTPLFSGVWVGGVLGFRSCWGSMARWPPWAMPQRAQPAAPRMLPGACPASTCAALRGCLHVCCSAAPRHQPNPPWGCAPPASLAVCPRSDGGHGLQLLPLGHCNRGAAHHGGRGGGADPLHLPCHPPRR